ncbi:hypothetical protein [Sinorhizobium meliloti]|uniref:hypothetical protein n=1 Tax=Rhizobium meliloti TaxID=382 RepID=UPI001F1F1B31|nr:hypothetical protein [Sinorhizobium meliloti]
MPTTLALGIIRTQLFSPDDLEKVKQIQARYKAAVLSAYAGTPAPAALRRSTGYLSRTS